MTHVSWVDADKIGNEGLTRSDQLSSGDAHSIHVPQACEGRILIVLPTTVNPESPSVGDFATVVATAQLIATKCAAAKHLELVILYHSRQARLHIAVPASVVVRHEVWTGKLTQDCKTVVILATDMLDGR